MSDSTEMTIRGGSGAMFDRIARRYDMLNRIMSLGMDQRWRRRTVKALELKPGDHVLDLATGTGDLALRIARRNPEVSVVGVDPSEGMLGIGRDKVARAGLASRIELVVGDAQALPLPSASVDGACIAFGIRNVPDRARGLAEMARVVRTGRKVCVLELGEPRRGIFAPFTRFHIRVIVPRLGALLSGQREYRYLQQSVAAFPPPDEFATMMEVAGLTNVTVRTMGFGACNLYVGEVAA